MKPNHPSEQDLLSQEDLLITLDQLHQTVEVMGAVINRLKRDLSHSLSSGHRPTEPDPKTSPPIFDFENLPDTSWH